MRALVHYGQEFGKEVTEIDADARAILERYAYPGNIRELQNIIERAMIFCHGRTLTASYLPRELHEAATQTAVAHLFDRDTPRSTAPPGVFWRCRQPRSK